MKTLTLMLPLVLALPVAAGQDPPVPWANKFFSGKDQVPPPVILHDFGTLPKGTVKVYRFPMTNIYGVPMQVKEPSASCGCVSVVEYTGKMGPLETGHVLVELRTAGFDGYKSVKIPVTFVGRDPKTDEPFFSTALLEIRAVSRADVAINPGALAFGQVPAGQKAESTVTVTYSGRQPNWQITEVGYRKELFESVAVARVPAPRGSTAAYQVTAKVNPTAPAGPLEEQVVLKTNDPAVPALTLSVTGAVQAALSVHPSDVVKFVTAVEFGQKGSRSVTLQAGKPFKVKAVEGQGDGVSVTLLPVPASKAQVLTVDFAPEKVGVVKKTLTVKTDTGEAVKLTVEAVGKDPQ